MSLPGVLKKCNLTIVKLGMTDWASKEERMTSENGLKLRFSKYYWDIIRAFSI